MNGKVRFIRMLCMLLWCCVATPSVATAGQASVPPRLAQKLAAGTPQEVIVFLDATTINMEVDRMRQRGRGGD